MCSGHGECGPDGGCACGGHWAGDACGACAPGYHGDACDRVCLSGTTVARTCVCDEGVAGGDCAVRCPSVTAGAGGGPPLVCAGHGLCDGGPRGTGACVCAGPYTGLACELLCPGGEAGVSCSGHGISPHTRVPLVPLHP